MAKFNLLVLFPKTFRNPKKLDLKDVLGAEFEDYYDGSGFDAKTGERDFFFCGIPENLIELIPKRLNGFCNYKITPDIQKS